MIYELSRSEEEIAKLHELVDKSFGRVSTHFAGSLITFEELYEEYKVVAIEELMENNFNHISADELYIEINGNISKGLIVEPEEVIMDVLLSKGYSFVFNGEVFNPPFPAVW